MNAGPLGQKGKEKNIYGEQKINRPISILPRQVFLCEDKQGERWAGLGNGGRVIPEAFADVYSGGILCCCGYTSACGRLCSPSFPWALPCYRFSLRERSQLSCFTCSWLSRICVVIPANGEISLRSRVSLGAAPCCRPVPCSSSSCLSAGEREQARDIFGIGNHRSSGLRP